jgi:hypothetical protein
VRRSWIFAVGLAAASSCGGLGEPVDPYHCRDSYCVGGDVTASYTAIFNPLLLDMVVVLDDSVPSGPGATVLEQALRLAAGYLTEPMSSASFGIDIHVALVPAAYAPGSPPSSWPSSPTCAQLDGPFLHASQMCDSPGNVAGELSDALAGAALAMTPSARPPRPLDALRTVLATPGAEGSFRRPEAFLAVMLISTTDDPGLATPAQVAEQHDYLAGLVADPDRGLTLGIVAPGSAQGLFALAASFGDAGRFSDIASSDWPALPDTVRDYAFHESWPACLDGPVIDMDPSRDGVQPDCVCIETRISATQRTEAVIPACPDGGAVTRPCWRITQDTLRCPKGGLDFVIDGWRPQCMPSYAVRYSLTCAASYEQPEYSP